MKFFSEEWYSIFIYLSKIELSIFFKEFEKMDLQNVRLNRIMVKISRSSIFKIVHLWTCTHDMEIDTLIKLREDLAIVVEKVYYEVRVIYDEIYDKTYIDNPIEKTIINMCTFMDIFLRNIARQIELKIKPNMNFDDIEKIVNLITGIFETHEFKKYIEIEEYIGKCQNLEKQIADSQIKLGSNLEYTLNDCYSLSSTDIGNYSVMELDEIGLCFGVEDKTIRRWHKIYFLLFSIFIILFERDLFFINMLLFAINIMLWYSNIHEFATTKKYEDQKIIINSNLQIFPKKQKCIIQFDNGISCKPKSNVIYDIYRKFNIFTELTDLRKKIKDCLESS
jgi:hypothetical protein